MDKQKIIIFVDGENFIRRVIENFFDINKFPRYFKHHFFRINFDFEGFFKSLVSDDQELLETRYYDARLNGFFSADHRENQKTFNDKLKKSGIKLKLGKIQGNPNNGAVKQKGVDTQLAIDLVTFGVEKKYDVAFLVSNDWDFLPAVSFIQKGKKTGVSYVFCHEGYCKSLFDSCRYRKKFSKKNIKVFCSPDLWTTKK